MSVNSRERRASSAERTTRARPTISISNSSPAFTPKASIASGGNETKAVSSRVVILFDIMQTLLSLFYDVLSSKQPAEVQSDQAAAFDHSQRFSFHFANPKNIMASLSVRSQLRRLCTGAGIRPPRRIN